MTTTPGPLHSFHAAAFVENLSLRELAPLYPEAKRTPHELWFTTAAGGTVFICPCGAMVSHTLTPEERGGARARWRRARPGRTEPQVFDEEFTVREDPGARPDVAEGILTLDKMTFERASVVA